MKTLLLFAALLAFTIVSRGQGTVRGKITDEKGETIIGATVVQKTNHSVWSVADLDGNYSIKIPDSLPQTIVISFISYKTIEENVQLKNGEVIVKNFVMQPAAHETKEVEISAKAVRSKEYYTEMVKRNSAVTLDYISSETMKKTGDANLVAAVARVTGVSVYNGFVTVRGIGDRYVKTAVNGSTIPTLDPFTNNIKLDIFPSSLVDNIIITKTASPDLPGDWAGAYLSVETKDYPEELALNLETSVGYNSQSTFKDVISSQHSSSDWMGYDNGFRDHNHEQFVEADMEPTLYQELAALGLKSYYDSLGVTSQNWSQDNNNGDLYFKLGLVRLGLLPAALINDAAAFADAKTAFYSGSYEQHAFNTINANVPASGKSFPNNWNTTRRNAPLNFSQTFSVGNQAKLFGKQIGFLLGYRYGSGVEYDPHSLSNRGRSNGSLESSVEQESTVETNGWSGLVNLACKLNPNHSISLLFMPNISGVNKVRYGIDDREAGQNIITRSQFYEERRQLVYQLKSEHYIPSLKLKAELNASYTDGKSSAPDFKNLQYWKDATTNTYQIGGSIADGVHRYYRYLSDNVFDSRLSMEFPLGQKPGLSRKLKFGGAYTRNDRKSDQYDYQLWVSEKASLALVDDDIDQFFNLDNFDISGGNSNGVPYSTIKEYYTEGGSPKNHTFGKSEIEAGFIMLDYALLSSLRISGGLRIENANYVTDVFKFDSLGYGYGDPRRDPKDGSLLVNPGTLKELSFLPSANLIYKINKNETAPVNLRLNYSRTVARPSLRELSDIGLYDYEFKSFVFGNSDLKMVHVDNYDLRLESYFKSGDNISLSLFCKKFKDHIELVNSSGYTWQNVDHSSVTGIELEGRKKFLNHFEFSANVAFIHSETRLVRSYMEVAGGVRTFVPIDTLTRTMFGQAPYVVNAILSYTADSIGLGITVSYNIQGKRLVLTSRVKEIPDVFEMPENMLDAKISKKLGRHFSVSVTAKNILNAPLIWQYGDGNPLLTDSTYDRYRYGTSYILGVSYKL